MSTFPRSGFLEMLYGPDVITRLFFQLFLNSGKAVNNDLFPWETLLWVNFTVSTLTVGTTYLRY